METATAVYGVQAMASLLRLLPERDPHPHLFESLNVILDHLSDPSDGGELYIRFELAVLDDLGYGLNLSECAATGTRQNLTFVSPKSGRAVCQEAGLPWADKMLALPMFLTEGAQKAATLESLDQAFKLTGFFLLRHVYEPRGLEVPDSRHGFVQAALKALAQRQPVAAE